MPPEPPEVGEAIRQFNEGALCGSILMRSLLQHRPWLLPALVDEDGATRVRLVEVDDDVFLDVFTDIDALNAYRSDGMADPDTTIVETTVAPILESLEAPVTHLRVNPSSTDALLYDAEQFSLFADLARALAVEHDLATGAGGDPWEQTLRDYDGFWIAAHNRGDDHQTVLLDDDGRLMLAVFTAEDCLDLFLLDHDESPEGLTERIRIDGRALFALLRTLPVVGVVFNPAGPVDPLAFDLDGSSAHDVVGEA